MYLGDCYECGREFRTGLRMPGLCERCDRREHVQFVASYRDAEDWPSRTHDMQERLGVTGRADE